MFPPTWRTRGRAAAQSARRRQHRDLAATSAHRDAAQARRLATKERVAGISGLLVSATVLAYLGYGAIVHPPVLKNGDMFSLVLGP
jgi:hypothetical protein